MSLGGEGEGEKGIMKIMGSFCTHTFYGCS